MLRYILKIIFISAVLLVTACGGGGGGSTTPSSTPVASSISSHAVSSSSSSVETSFTRYTLKVNPPALASAPANSKTQRHSLGANKIQGNTELTKKSFAVITVDLSGKILERIEIPDNQITQDPDGNWVIQVPGNPRLDRIIVASLSQQLVLPVTGTIYADTDFLLAATTDQELEVDIGSTAAYKSFIKELGGTGTFDDLNLDAAAPENLVAFQSLIDNIQLAIEDISFTQFSDIDDAITAIKTVAAAIAKQEVLNIKNATSADLANALITEGGVAWFEGNQSRLITTNGEITYDYQQSNFINITGSDNRVVQELIWTANGWSYNPKQFLAATANSDGSVGLSEQLGGVQLQLDSLQSFDLNGRNIAEFINANNLPFTAEASKTFGANTKGFRANSQRSNSVYQLELVPGNNTGKCPWDDFNAADFGGNCARQPGLFIDVGPGFNWINAYQSLRGATPLLSADVNHTQVGFRSVILSWQGNISAQFVDNAAKTVRYYQNLDSSSGTAQGNLIAEGTWKEIVLGAGNVTSTLVAIELPQIVLEKGNFYGLTNLIFAEHNGFLRRGTLLKPAQSATNSLIINGAALTDIMAANDHSPRELVKNGGLELSEAGSTAVLNWKLGEINNAEVDFTVVDTEAHSGKHSLSVAINKLATDTNTSAFIYSAPAPINVKGSAYYQLKGWVKGTAGAKASLGVANPAIWEFFERKTIIMTGDWQEFSFSLKTKADVQKLAFGVDLNIQGNAGARFYFDDFSAAEITTHNLTVTNGGLEQNFQGDAQPSGWLIYRGWFFTDAIITVDTTEKHSGQNSLKIDVVGNGYIGDWPFARLDNVIVKPNTDYRLSGWVKGPAGLKAYGSAVEPYTWHKISQSNITLSGEWQEFSLTVKTPVDVFLLGLDFNVDVSTIGAGRTLETATIYLDDFDIKEDN